jgi:FMN-dependent NADH-azoreductase
MTAILHISSSSDLQSSVTREVGAAALTSLKKTLPGAIVIERDLVKTSDSCNRSTSERTIAI